MTGTVILCDLAVICGNLRGIMYHQGDGGTGGPAFEDSGENLHLIGLLALSGDGTGAGFAAV